MDMKEEIEKILENSESYRKFIEKAEFLEKSKGITIGDPSQVNVENWEERLADNKKMGDFWEFWQNTHYFHRNLEQIEETHGGKFVLIHNQEIVFSSENYDEVKNKITSLKLEPKQYIVYYVPKPGEDSVLYAGSIHRA